jgi:hydroxymethylpyrimidine/phosphomethylpyrimidine kinase
MSATVPTPIALTIAGSDSSGGAGIQADLKTFAACGVYAASVITAITAQNTKIVSAVQTVRIEMVLAQLDAVLEDLDVKAIKIGMIPESIMLGEVLQALKAYENIPIVLDPVMIATSGSALADQNYAKALLDYTEKKQITLLTPNRYEASVLTGLPPAQSEEELKAQGRALLETGFPAVLMKGGHMMEGDLEASAQNDVSNPVTDWLIMGEFEQGFSAPFIATQNTHGSGCSLSSAIAAGLAKGLDLPEAVTHARNFITHALQASDSLQVGHGPGPLHHFYSFW